MAFTTIPISQPDAQPAAPGRAEGVARNRSRRHPQWTRFLGCWRRVGAVASGQRTRTLLFELVVLAAVLAVVGAEAPRLATAVGDGLARLAHPDLVGLSAAAAADAVSLVALSQVPRLLLARAGVRLGRVEALVLTLASNGMAVVLPAGTVTSSVWLARQYARRGARLAVATWVVLAAGFAEAVTLIGVLLVGAFVGRVVAPVLVAVVTVVFVVATAGFVALVHRAEGAGATVSQRGASQRGPLPAAPPVRQRLAGRLAGLVGETAGQRAGWRTGTAVLFACGVNWLADAACLGSVFVLLRLPVPWRALLVAYAAGQLVGSLVPVPGGLGAVEGGMTGVLVAFGVAAGPALAAVAVYRLLGYWFPTMAAVPSYGLAQRLGVVERPPELAPAGAEGAPGPGWRAAERALAGGAGIEPATFGSKVRRSAN